MDQVIGQAADGMGKRKIAHLLVVAMPGIVDRYNRACPGKVVAITSALPQHGRKNCRMPILAVDDVRLLVKDDHQVQSCLLQKDIHGKIVKMTTSRDLIRVACFILCSVCVDGSLFPITVCINQVDCHPLEFLFP